MSASDMKLERSAASASRAEVDEVASSLNRTLENLEARLSRLAAGRPAQEATAPRARPTDAHETAHLADRLRAIAEQRLAGASRLAMEATDAGDAVSRRRYAGAALDRRIGTIAGEVEALRIQGSTLQLVTAIADEVQSLRTELAAGAGTANKSEFAEIHAAFEDIRARIAATDRAGGVGDQVADVMRRLSEMRDTTLDRAALEPLRKDLERVEALIERGAQEETVAAGTRRWEDFEARLSAHMDLDANAKEALQAEIERLRQAVRSLASEEQMQALEERWDAFEARHFEAARTEMQERFGTLLRTELRSLGERIDLIAASAVPAADFGEQVAATQRAGEALERLTARLGELEDALVELPAILGIERIEERLEELADGLTLIARQQQEPELEHFAILEERLDEISEAIVAGSIREERVFDTAPIERIEARLADLSARVERLGSTGQTAELSDRILGLSARLDDMAEPAVAAADADRLADYSARIEAALERIEQPNPHGFEERLAALGARLEQVAAAQIDEDVLVSLKTHIAALGERINVGGTAVDEDLRDRLSAVEERLERNREDVVLAARAAADEAVRLMQVENGSRDQQHVRDLSGDMRDLEALFRETDSRSHQVFEAVHSTLVKIAERLKSIESELGDERGERTPTPSAAVRLPEPASMELAGAVGDEERPVARRGLRAAIARHLGRRSPDEADEIDRAAEPTLVAATPTEARGDDTADTGRTRIEDAPSIDAADTILFREANRPLEPGSGAPDIASLIDRVRAQQQRVARDDADPAGKADFIAAARKAAMAAAAEAETLRHESSADGENGNAASGAGRDPGRHRRPVLMAVGAVLLALMAIPLGRMAVQTELPRETIETAAIAPAAQPLAPRDISVQVEPSETRMLAEPPVTTGSVQPVVAVNTHATMPADRPSVAELAAARAGAAGPLAAGLVTPAAMPPARQIVQSPAPSAENAVRVADTRVAAAPRQDAAVLAAAVARLPESARADLPPVPAGIGPQALASAVDAGDPKAIFEVGLRLMEGRAGESDVEGAFRWFAHAGTLGYAPAQYSLGTLYEKGNGIERDTAAAREWYRLSAEQGNVRAMHNLAVLYATGVDGRSEPETAARWFTAAAEHGMRDSQYNLGILHARGAGVVQDFGQSYKWFSIVGASGDRDATEKRGEVAKTLSAVEIAALDAEVAAFTPQPRIEAANAVEVPPAWTDGGEQTASVDMTRAIRNVQAILIKLGFEPGTPDGVAGSRTTQAVRAFQEQNGLEITGRIDETLIRELLRQNV